MSRALVDALAKYPRPWRPDDDGCCVIAANGEWVAERVHNRAELICAAVNAFDPVREWKPLPA